MVKLLTSYKGKFPNTINEIDIKYLQVLNCQANLRLAFNLAFRCRYIITWMLDNYIFKFRSVLIETNLYVLLG